MLIPGFIKTRLLSLKYYLLQYTEEEITARKALSNVCADSAKEVGMLIAGAFMASKVMSVSLRVAFERLQAQESVLFPKSKQYYKSLLFLQKVAMQSEHAQNIVRDNYLRILPFAFYNKNYCSVTVAIRLLAISVLKLVNSQRFDGEASHTTFVTCVSHGKHPMEESCDD
ncbi:hypothetical protein NEDG_01992 [Nematocida displodere]|uniref:Uncharacterized protein n=1 Tax=Nematocida displodere TaxID=1805483 RepID=A0A177EGB4_9MICR|nr:hypothetical protein NEDG_01992 [Nematocida displodere]